MGIECEFIPPNTYFEKILSSPLVHKNHVPILYSHNTPSGYLSGQSSHHPSPPRHNKPPAPPAPTRFTHLRNYFHNCFFPLVTLHQSAMDLVRRQPKGCNFCIKLKMRLRLYLGPFIVAGRRSTTSPPIRPSPPLVGHPGDHRPCQTSKSSAQCQGSSISQVPSSSPYQLIQCHHPLAVGTGARESKNNVN